MFKFLLVFILMVNVCSAQVGTVIRGQTPDGKFEKFLQVDEEGQLKIVGDIELGDVSVDAVPSFKDSDDVAVRALVDGDYRALVNLGSETIGLITALEAIRDANASETTLVGAIDAVVVAVQSTLNADVNLATDSIGLITTLEAIRDANASETNLIAAIDAVKDAVEATLEADVNLATDSIGLITALEAIRDANASETALVSAIDAVTTAIQSTLNADVTLATDSIGLITALEAIRDANASETNLIAAIDNVRDVLEPASSVQCDAVTVGDSVVEVSASGAVETLVGRRSVTIQNNSSSVSLWYRISGIVPEVGTGFQITPNGLHTIPVDDSIVVKMIAASEIPVVVYQEAR